MHISCYFYILTKFLWKLGNILEKVFENIRKMALLKLKDFNKFEVITKQILSVFELPPPA